MCYCLVQEDIQDLLDQEARVDQLITHVKEQLKKLVRPAERPSLGEKEKDWMGGSGKG